MRGCEARRSQLECGVADETNSGSLSAEEVRKVARLARLELTDEQVEVYRGQLGAVLGYFERLREVNLEGVEPLTHVVGEAVEARVEGRLDLDEPRAGLANEALMRMAPEKMPPFLRVPKVLGEQGE